MRPLARQTRWRVLAVTQQRNNSFYAASTLTYQEMKIIKPDVNTAFSQLHCLQGSNCRPISAPYCRR
jgi:hypothetical protein